MTNDVKTVNISPAFDLDAAEQRVSKLRGSFRVMSYEDGEELLEFIPDGGCDDCPDDIAQFACDDEIQLAIVATLNEAPALIAEVRALRAQVCRLVSGQEVESDALCQHHDADLAAIAADKARAVAAEATHREAEIFGLRSRLEIVSEIADEAIASASEAPDCHEQVQDYLERMRKWRDDKPVLADPSQRGPLPKGG